ncbi:hypothetical protein TWF694_005184 [Orbilia ellipsospora]|uniref:Uncharacterized protein n=1 Tax=Orbilia ellipsospora TaxID=2528407 RepID=A0AAV9WUZ1_9PEZI
MKTSLICLGFLSLATWPSIHASPPSIHPRASLEFGNHQTTISASLSFVYTGPHPPSTKSEPTNPTTSFILPSRNPLDLITSHRTNAIITHPLTTQQPLTTFIQDDDLQSPNPNNPPNSKNTTRTCRDFPSAPSLKICNAKFLVFIFLLLYIIILRAIFYLQELSARHVLDLGEKLARCRDSYDGWAWEVMGSWKIRQQPELPAIAMIGATYGATWRNGNGSEGNSGGAPESIGMQDLDLDYRRRRNRTGNNTPEEEVNTGGNGNEQPLPQQQEEEERVKREAEEQRYRMIKTAHQRILDDTKGKRLVYGVGVSFATLGVAFVVLAAFTGILCGQIWKIGLCPYHGIKL